MVVEIVEKLVNICRDRCENSWNVCGKKKKKKKEVRSIVRESKASKLIFFLI